MLDAFIIDRIRRHRDLPDGVQYPLRIEVPMPPSPQEWRPPEPPSEDCTERGIVDIDFSV